MCSNFSVMCITSVRNEQKHVSATTLQKLPLREDGGELTVMGRPCREQMFRAGGAWMAQSRERLLWVPSDRRGQPPKASCTPAGGLGRLPTVCMVEEPSQSPWRAGGQGWSGERGLPGMDGQVAKHKVSSDCGWGPHGPGIGCTLGYLGRSLKGTEHLPPAGGGCVLWLLRPALPAPQAGGQGDMSAGPRGSHCRQ